MKNFVLDTNVILYSPNCLETFQENNVIIPSMVLEELDNFKRHYDPRGFAARQFSRQLDDLRQRGDLLKGVETDAGGKLFVRFYDEDVHLPREMQVTSAKTASDNMILNVALSVQKESNLPTIVVSKDINVRIKANILGVESEDYYHNKTISSVEEDTLFVLVPSDFIDRLYQEKVLPVAGYRSDSTELSPYSNDYLLLKNETDLNQSALVQFRKNERGDGNFHLLEKMDDVFGIRPRNHKQRFLMDAILTENTDLVFAMGIAGSGKTLVSLACALEMVLEERFKRLIIARPIIPMGPDPGALPGTEYEKVRPWLQPIYDNLEFLVDNLANGGGHGKGKDLTHGARDITLQYLFDAKLIDVQTLAYIRGRSVSNGIFMIDEAQNLTPHEVKTIITRAGENTKIIMTGDIYQIDSPYMTSADNGLAVASEKFRLSDVDISASIFLDKGERSRLATMAANIL
ncbi:MAG: PhoH family protein [bacterium]|nr:PhoH family protein [bacterium]MDT8396282.1 PhoH family protein [bacterium]